MDASLPARHSRYTMREANRITKRRAGRQGLSVWVFELFELCAVISLYSREANRITKRRAGRVRFGTAVRTFGATNHKKSSAP